MKFYLLAKKLMVIAFINYSIASCMPAALVAVGAVQAQKDTTLGQTIDQNLLAVRIKSSLLASCPPDWRFLYFHISVVAEGSVIYLSGVLETEEQILKAIQIAWEEEGVKEVVNGLNINEDSKKLNLKQYFIDTSITSSIKSRMLFTKGVKSINYTVITFNNIVYMFGLARSQQELNKVQEIAASNKGVEEVISHIKIIEE
jgi:hypothetical protein